MNLNRRNFLRGSTLLGAGLGTEMLASRTASAQHKQHQHGWGSCRCPHHLSWCSQALQSAT
jgi:hypothetical protein